MERGRPTIYSQGLVEKICEQIADGKSLRSICEADEMPARSTIFKWLSENKSFSDQYARARQTQADAIFDEILSIADEAKNDTFIDENGVERANAEVIARSRLRVDVRKWMAGKLRPKVYGERLELAGDPQSPLAVEIAVRPQLSREEWLAAHGIGKTE